MSKFTKLTKAGFPLINNPVWIAGTKLLKLIKASERVRRQINAFEKEKYENATAAWELIKSGANLAIVSHNRKVRSNFISKEIAKLNIKLNVIEHQLLPYKKELIGKEDALRDMLSMARLYISMHAVRIGNVVWRPVYTLNMHKSDGLVKCLQPFK